MGYAEELESLKIQAMMGDSEAALQYFLTLRSLESNVFQHLEAPVLAPIPIQAKKERISGVLSFYPESSTKILIYSHEEGRQLLSIFGVDYDLRATYFYYPELGWISYGPIVIQHAKLHQERYLERIASGEFGETPDTSGRGQIMYWLPNINNTSEDCPICGGVMSDDGKYQQSIRSNNFATEIGR